MNEPVLLGDSEGPLARRAVALGARLAAVESDPRERTAIGVCVEIRDGRLEARLADWPRSAAYRVEFESISPSEARRSPLVRAAGDPPGRLLDATAGFGGDAMRFAAAGWEVVACERNPWIRWLLEDGLAAAAGDSRIAAAAGRILIAETPEANDVVAAIEQGRETPIDVVLLDPMYPVESRGKRALPPKAAQLLRALVGEDPGAAELLGRVRRIARRRVIVKRPAWAKPIADGCVHSIGSKLLRIDAYLPISTR